MANDAFGNGAESHSRQPGAPASGNHYELGVPLFGQVTHACGGGAFEDEGFPLGAEPCESAAQKRTRTLLDFLGGCV